MNETYLSTKSISITDLCDLDERVKYLLINRMQFESRNNLQNIENSHDNNIYYIQSSLEFGYYIVRKHNLKLELHTDSNTIDLMNMLSPTTVKLNTNKVLEFISIIRDYIPVKIDQVSNDICNNCKNDLKINSISCENCGLILNNQIFTEDQVTKQKSTYSLKQNFIKAINKFEGKGNVPVYVIQKINEEINSRQIKIEHVNRELLFIILKHLGFNKYYDDINAIYSIITKNPAINVQHLLSKLILFQDKFEFAYVNVKDPNRINSLNVYFKLMKGLHWCNFHCTLDEFCILKTETKLIEHEQIFEKICNILNWDYNSFPKII